MKTHRLCRPLILLITFCILPISLYGEDTEKHKIDLWLTKAMERNYSTAGMRNALNQARQMWDKEMNRSYSKLMKGLPANKRQILKKSQRAWIAFRDADGAAIGAIISSRSGTMHQLEGTDASYQRVRDRALQLRAYENALPELMESHGTSFSPSPKPNFTIKHLKPGSSDRKAICNAFRIPMTREVNGQKILFVIHRITVWNDTAFIHCSPQRTNGKSVDWSKTRHAERYREGMFDNTAVGLLRRNSKGQWTVIDFDLGMTDVSYENWPEKHKVPRDLIFGR